MADAATALAPPQQGAPDPLAAMKLANTNINQLLSGEKTTTDKYEQATSDIDRDTAASDAVSDRQMAGVTVPTLPADAGKPFTPPAPTDPKQVWASAAMVLAGLGSLLTRQPLTTAMNAAAGAIQAFHKGDQEAANAALQQWKSAQDTYLKIANFQEAATHDLVQQMRDLRDAHDKESEAKKRDLTTEYKARMASFQNQIVAQFRSSDEVLHYSEAMAINNTRLEESSNKVMQANAIGQGLAAFKKAHPNATPDEILTETGRLQNLIGHQWTDQEVDQHVEEFKKRAQSSVPGKNYDAAASNVGPILNMDPNQPVTPKSIIDQVAGMEKYVQQLNGNRAMRGFQLKLLQQDEGLLNTLRIKAQQIGGSGMLSPDMMSEMKKVAADLSHVAALQYADYITSGQYEKWKVHLDPTLFVPDNYHPNEDPEAESYPSPFADDDATRRNVEFLKSHPTRENWLFFDDHYGQGSAALVMEPATASDASADAAPVDGSPPSGT